MKISSFHILVIIELIIVTACFTPWAKIPSSGITLYGFDTTPTNLGKPAILTLIFSLLTSVVYFLFRTSYWGRNASLFIAALLVSWHIRNWLLLSICNFGECLEIVWTFYVLSFVILVKFIHLISQVISPRSA